MMEGCRYNLGLKNIGRTIIFSFGGSRNLKNMTLYHWTNLDNPSTLELDDYKSTITNYLDN